VERARQSIADAELADDLARRALRTLSGVTPAGAAAPVADDLHDERALEAWESAPDESLPPVATALEQRRSAEQTALAAKLALLPTIVGVFLERITNATGFVQTNAFYTVSATAAWRLDLTSIAVMRSQAIAAETAGVRAQRARLVAHDQIHEAWQRVRAGIVKSRAARAEARAAVAAAERAGERYGLGAGTQLEVVQAQRDAFSAEVARIQADADLVYARALLRLDAGQPLDGARGRP
jgi:outer membrane protein TolC